MPQDYMSEEELSSPKSLMQVYTCIALAKSFLNLDVLWHLELERKRTAGELDDADADVMEAHFEDMDPRLRRFRMRDDYLHRMYLPLTCAIQLCDQIRPARLAYLVADYLAEIIPYFVTSLSRSSSGGFVINLTLVLSTFDSQKRAGLGELYF
jgi:hypothetical protein